MQKNELQNLDTFSKKEINELQQVIWEWLDDFVEEHAVQMYRNPFIDICYFHLYEFLQSCLGGVVELEEPMEEFLQENMDTYLIYKSIPPRAISQFIYAMNDGVVDGVVDGENNDDEKIKEQIKQRKRINRIKKSLRRLRNIDQPVQRTPEWYAMRCELLTATAIAKLFFSTARTNSVIYEKCVGETPRPPLSATDARNWGVIYEPISRMIYETMYETHVKEYGIIRHPVHSFIGASPDGINVDKSCMERYGRMVEIKNIVNREITGEPLDEYWIQMQVQMEVCQLPLCDFVETRIKEYTDADEYYAITNAKITKQQTQQPAVIMPDFYGVVLQFNETFVEAGVDTKKITTTTNKPPPQTNLQYDYMPLGYGLNDRKKIDKWIQKTTRKREKQGFELVNTRYWYLDEFSCVVVERNSYWFGKALSEIRRVWETILTERQTGFQHRAAKSKKYQGVSNEILLVNKVVEETAE